MKSQDDFKNQLVGALNGEETESPVDELDSGVEQDEEEVVEPKAPKKKIRLKRPAAPAIDETAIDPSNITGVY